MNILKPFKRRTPAIDAELARKLTSDFLDGMTTPEQERMLYDYYRLEDLPKDLRGYRKMFAWYTSVEKSKTMQRRRIIRTDIAAAIAVLAVAGASVWFSRSERSDLSDRYAGSYIIRDGKKITDIDLILPELQKAESETDSILKSMEEMVLDNSADEIILQSIRSIEDPELRKEIYTSLTDQSI